MAKSRRRRLVTVMRGHGQARGAVVWEAAAPEVIAVLRAGGLSYVTELQELSSRSVERLGREL